MALIQFLKYEE